jgi:hypothetical protein
VTCRIDVGLSCRGGFNAWLIVYPTQEKDGGTYTEIPLLKTDSTFDDAKAAAVALASDKIVVYHIFGKDETAAIIPT